MSIQLVIRRSSLEPHLFLVTFFLDGKAYMITMLSYESLLEAVELLKPNED
jgi:hypothetical protein